MISVSSDRYDSRLPISLIQSLSSGMGAVPPGFKPADGTVGTIASEPDAVHKSAALFRGGLYIWFSAPAVANITTAVNPKATAFYVIFSYFSSSPSFFPGLPCREPSVRPLSNHFSRFPQEKDMPKAILFILLFFAIL